MRRRTLLFTIGILLLIIPEILRVYLIMPFPGSQLYNTIGLAYFIFCFINVFRIAGGILVIVTLISFWKKGKWFQRLITSFLVLLYVAIFYLANYTFSAEHMFLEPKQKVFLPADKSVVPDSNLVIGVFANGEAHAYPIQYIGYHHMVQDTVGNTPVYITYCTVCRSGRAYSQFLDGERIQFRLRGMDHFNAMFEDIKTTSWWRQENGEAIAGKMKGKMLEEFPSQQTTLKAWIRLHPNTLILQPDPEFVKEYKLLRKYDYGTIKNELEYTDSVSWNDHSWVVGLQAGDATKAYDWNILEKLRFVNDTIGTAPVFLLIEDDDISFHAYHRTVEQQTLTFEWNDSTKTFQDANTRSHWNYDGQCVQGVLKGRTLTPITAYQEFWLSWKSFHPDTHIYKEQ